MRKHYKSLNLTVLDNSDLKFKVGVLLLCLVFSIGLMGQGLHFSQVNSAPLQINPALTGAFEGDARVSSLYRRQWFNVPVSYETVIGSADFNVVKHCSACAPFSFGALFSYDVAGYSRLSGSQLSLSAVSRRPLFGDHLISFGLMAGLGQRSFKVDDLLTGAVSADSGFESSYDDLFKNNEFMYFDVSAGINARFNLEPARRTYLDAGFAVYHINRHNTSFTVKNETRQPVQYNVNLLGNLEVQSKLDVLLRGTALIMGNGQSEVLLAGGIRYYFGDKADYWNSFAIEGLGGIRLDDAIIPMVGIFYRGWRLGLSYDFNYSDFGIATQNNGGPELSLGYIHRKVRVGKAKRFCPIHL